MENLRCVYTCGLANNALPGENGRRTMTHVYNLKRDACGYYLTCQDLVTGEEALTWGPEADRVVLDIFLNVLIAGRVDELRPWVNGLLAEREVL